MPSDMLQRPAEKLGNSVSVMGEHILKVNDSSSL
jgi:hypothetical protein